MGVRNSFQNTFSCYLEDASKRNATRLLASKSMDSAVTFSESTANVLVPQYSIQRILRPLYHKGEPQRPDIGDHPDFKHLLGTDQVIKCQITTLFMDIESSTRLSLLYPLEDVFRIKNAFVRVAMEIIKSFNGHVHRIMGDAVMAYFGGRTVAPESGIVDGLNCASVLGYFVEQSVVPKLNSMGYKEPFGIRVGVDFGKEADVLWSSYGYPGMEEVTATSFFVDVASKLQHAASRNQIMIGESIRSFIDFPEDLLSVKSVTLNGNKVPVPYLQPNHTDGQGNPINYRQYELNWNAYLKHSPIAQFDPTYHKNADGIRITAEIYSERGGQFEGIYSPTSRFLPKGKSVKFSLNLPYLPLLPYTIKFKVENHGVDARNKAGDICGNHVTDKIVSTVKEHENIVHWEDTAYRGLHFMIIEVYTHQRLSHKTQFGVFIE